MKNQTIGNLTIVNTPSYKGCKKHIIQVCTNAYMVFADCEGDALDEVIDYIAEHSPGLLADDMVKEEYEQALADGADEETAHERATVDIITGGNCGNHLVAWEVGMTSNPTREYILRLQKRIAA